MREIVVIGLYDNPAEAQVAKAALEEAGVKAFLADEQSVGMNWLLGAAIGGIKLQVHRDDLKLAEKVLSDQSPAEFGDESPEDFAEDEEEVFDSLDGRGQNSDDEKISPLSAREANAERALKAAMFGILLCPLQLYAWYLLDSVYFSNERLDPKYRKRAWLAAALTAPYVFILLWIILLNGLRVLVRGV